MTSIMTLMIDVISIVIVIASVLRAVDKRQSKSPTIEGHSLQNI